MRACPITGADRCADPHCELHAIQSPMRLITSNYADQIMGLIADDERHGPLTRQDISSYADLCKHTEPDKYLRLVGIDTLDGNFVNDVLHADFLDQVRTLIDRGLTARATARKQLHAIMQAQHAIGSIDAHGVLGFIADTRSTFHNGLQAAAYELTFALVRLAAPNHSAASLPRITADTLDSYTTDPTGPASVAERIHDAIEAEAPF